jgi:cell division protein FtsB
MMHHDNAGGPDKAVEQELQSLRARFEQLRDHKVRVEQDIRNLTGQLEALKERAKQEYGTDEPEELQALLQKKQQENERLVQEYRQHINDLQQGLAEVEQAFGESSRRS